MNTENAIKAIAQENKISAKQARADMIVAIHKAYLAGSPEFKILFGDREPSPEEFIEALSGGNLGRKQKAAAIIHIIVFIIGEP